MAALNKYSRIMSQPQIKTIIRTKCNKTIKLNLHIIDSPKILILRLIKLPHLKHSLTSSIRTRQEQSFPLRTTEFQTPTSQRETNRRKISQFWVLILKASFPKQFIVATLFLKFKETHFHRLIMLNFSLLLLNRNSKVHHLSPNKILLLLLLLQ